MRGGSVPGPAPYSARGVDPLPAAGARAGLQESHLLPAPCPSPEDPAGDGKRAEGAGPAFEHSPQCPRESGLASPGLQPRC